MSLPNVNVGVMGHVDSGKTSLVGALSTCLSTCALDKHPQSKRRGITLDLGFSSFVSQDKRYTLVDCPGHASLIRTIIGATQIIDIFLLVVDLTKGIQTQTAECLVLAEVSPCSRLVVVLNKTDLVPEAERAKRVDKLSKAIEKHLSRTKFKGCAVVACSAREEWGLDGLAGELARAAPHRRDGLAGPSGASQEDLVYAVDHCFAIKGQGTVLTGTVLQGTLRVGQNLQVPRLGLSRKVKTMQVFREPVQSASVGERVAVCTTQLDPKLIERDYLCEDGGGDGGQPVVRTFDACVCSCSRVSFFRGEVPSGAKIHVTLGYATTLAEATFFCCDGKVQEVSGPGFDYSRDYEHAAQLEERVGLSSQRVLLVFEKPVTCPTSTSYVASRLDLDANAKQCRLAFHGEILSIPENTFDVRRGERNLDAHRSFLSRLRVFKPKSRTGRLERIEKGSAGLVGIAAGFFGKDSDVTKFLGLRVVVAAAEGEQVAGRVASTFGKSGKVKVDFESSAEGLVGRDLRLEYKKYLFRR